MFLLSSHEGNNECGNDIYNIDHANSMGELLSHRRIQLPRPIILLMIRIIEEYIKVSFEYQYVEYLYNAHPIVTMTINCIQGFIVGVLSGLGSSQLSSPHFLLLI